MKNNMQISLDFDKLLQEKPKPKSQSTKKVSKQIKKPKSETKKGSLSESAIRPEIITNINYSHQHGKVQFTIEYSDDPAKEKSAAEVQINTELLKIVKNLF